MSRWQPIETAPINEPCLIWDGLDIYKAYQTDRNSWYQELANGDVFRNKDGWAVPFTKVTHWQPLPEKPDVR